MVRSIWIGFDPREAAAFAVARGSILRRLPPGDALARNGINGLILSDMRQQGLYWRETQSLGPARLWDVISDAPMSTEFAISRFLTPILAKRGWALFVDSDVMARADVNDLFALADPAKAVMCVKHSHRPAREIKMDGQAQTVYARKNWSSVMLFNCEHPSNKKLTVDLINTVPGRDLHRFCWLGDDEIGTLGHEWNWLVGHDNLTIDPKLVHFTDGVPSLPGYEHVPYADEWRAELSAWAS